jgi:hypothetical protein
MGKLVRYFLFILFTISSSGLFSQPEAKLIPKNYLSVDLITPFFRKYTLQYEKLVNYRDFVRLGIAFQYPKRTDSYENTLTGLVQINNKNIVFTTYRLNVGYGRFLISGEGFYIGADLFYSYKFYEKKYYYDCAGTSMDSDVYLKSEYNSNFELLFGIGYKILFNKSGKTKFVIEPYAGIGGILKLERHITYGSSPGSCSLSNFEYYDEPEAKNFTSIVPAIRIGLKAGVGF